jgi:hypothetical protein
MEWSACECVCVVGVEMIGCVVPRFSFTKYVLTRSRSSFSSSHKGADFPTIPALLTKISMGPNAVRTYTLHIVVTLHV